MDVKVFKRFDDHETPDYDGICKDCWPEVSLGARKQIDSEEELRGYLLSKVFGKASSSRPTAAEVLEKVERGDDTSSTESSSDEIQDE